MMRVWDRLSSARSTSLRAQHAGLGRLVLRGQHVLLLARGLEGGLVLGLARLGHVQAAAGLLIGLARAGALARQVAVALDFALGEAQVGGVGPRDRQRLADHRLMAFQRGVGVDELGRGHGQVGAGRGQGGHVFAVVDAGQQLAGGDALVVFRQHFLDEAGYLGRDHGVVGDDGGVVGGFGRRRARPGPAGVGKQAQRAGQRGAGKMRTDCGISHDVLDDQAAARGG